MNSNVNNVKKLSYGRYSLFYYNYYQVQLNLFFTNILLEIDSYTQ